MAKTNKDFAFYSVYQTSTPAQGWKYVGKYTKGYTHMFSNASSLKGKYAPYSVLINLENMTLIMADIVTNNQLNPVSDFVKKCDSL